MVEVGFERNKMSLFWIILMIGVWISGLSVCAIVEYYLRRTERSFKVGDFVWNYFYDECGEVVAIDKTKATVQVEDVNIRECVIESLIKFDRLPGSGGKK